MLNKLPFFKKKEKDEIVEVVTDENAVDKSDLQKRANTYMDLIAPDQLDFSNEKHMEIGDGLYAKNLYVGILPNSVSFASFLDRLYNHGDVDTSIFIRPIDQETAKADLSKLKTSLEVEYLGAEGSTNRREDMEAKVMEAKRIRDEVREGYNKLYDVGIVATIYADSVKELNNQADRLKSLLGQKDIGLKSAIFFQEKVYRSNKPLNKDLSEISHTFDKRSLAATFPFTRNNINHEGGTLLGFNMDNGLPVMYNNFSRQLDNYNMFVFAKSGSGKSTLIKSLAARTSTIDRIQNIAVDVEREYAVLARTLGGENIVIKPGTKTILNPFDIVADRVENPYTKELEDVVLLKEKINNVSDILMAMFKGRDGNPYMDDMARKVIKDAVKEEYKEIGITEEISSLYIEQSGTLDQDGNIAFGKRKKDMPTLSSWYQRLEKMQKENKVQEKNNYYTYILEIMEDYCKYKNGSFDCFDGQSTVSLTKEVPFINFDIKGLNEKTERPLAQFIITDYIWEQMVKRNQNSPHKMRLIIDEAWMFTKYKEAVEFLVTVARRARKYNTSLACITQQFQDFYTEDTQPILKNSDTKFFLKTDSTDYETIQEVFKLTSGEINFLKNVSKGQALMKANDTPVKVDIEIPDFEIDFIETNSNKKKEAS